MIASYVGIEARNDLRRVPLERRRNKAAARHDEIRWRDGGEGIAIDRVCKCAPELDVRSDRVVVVEGEICGPPRRPERRLDARGGNDVCEEGRVANGYEVEFAVPKSMQAFRSGQPHELDARDVSGPLRGRIRAARERE